MKNIYKKIRHIIHDNLWKELIARGNEEPENLLFWFVNGKPSGTWRFIHDEVCRDVRARKMSGPEERIWGYRP